MPSFVRSQLRRGICLVAGIAATLAVNCARSSGRRGDSTNQSILIPSGWDGRTDWDSPGWQVIDQAVGSLAEASHSNLRASLIRKPNTACVTKWSTFQRNKGTFLVRVKFFQGGALHSRLTGMSGIRRVMMRPSPEISELLLEVPDTDGLEDLASQTHNHFAGCAGIEVVAGPGIEVCKSGSVQNQAPVTPAVFDETIRLSAIESLLSTVNTANIMGKMTSLQQLGSRYYNGSQALVASNTVAGIMESAYAGTTWAGQAGTNLVTHPDFTQKSVLTTLPGTEDDETIIIIGSHLDSIHPSNQADAPGADDNASGIAIMAEVVRALSASGTRFKRRVEWHAYGIEEIGLIGSGQIASNYSATGKHVAAMLQLDMAAYAPEAGNDTIHLFPDDTTAGLRRSAKDLLTSYLGGNFTDRGGSVSGTSDHRSWYRAGFPTVFPFEDTVRYNRKMHTSEDTVSNANSPGLATRMAKLVITFLGHHAGILGADTEYQNKFASTLRDPDIKVAVVDASDIPETAWPAGLASDGSVIIFSGPESLSAVESCNTTGPGHKVCATDRNIGIKIENAPSGRSFFYAVTGGSPAESAVRIFGYGINNEPTHARSISIKRK